MSSGEPCVRANLFVRKFDGIGVIHSLPLMTDRRIRAQLVEGAQEMLRLFFDGVNGNFFVPESRFRSLLAMGDMSSGLVSGSRLAGGCFVIRGPSGVHELRDAFGKVISKCEGHEGLIFEMSRAVVVEAKARLEYLHGECAKLFGAADGTTPWVPFPRSADQRFLEEGMRGRGALSSIAQGDAAEMTEEERTAFLDSCFERDPSGEPEQVEEPEEAQASESDDSGKSDNLGEGEEEDLRAELIRQGRIRPAEQADQTNLTNLTNQSDQTDDTEDEDN